MVEGIGDHGCEYMTGGKVIILGKTGRNFAAGMSGGIAYVFDENKEFISNLCNKEMVDLDPLNTDDFLELKTHIEDHYKHTNSKLAHMHLDNWNTIKTKYVKVFPKDFKKALKKLSEEKLVLKKITA